MPILTPPFTDRIQACLHSCLLCLSMASSLVGTLGQAIHTQTPFLAGLTASQWVKHKAAAPGESWRVQWLCVKALLPVDMEALSRPIYSLPSPELCVSKTLLSV